MCDRSSELPCRQRPCQPPHDRNSSASPDDVNAGLKGRPVLYAGVVWIGIVRRFLIPRVCGTASSQNAHEMAATSTPAPKTVAHVQAVSASADVHEPPLLHKNKNMPVALVTERSEELSGDPREAMLRRRDGEGVSSSSPLKMLETQLLEVSAAAAAQVRGFAKDLGAILHDGQETTAEFIEVVRSDDGKNLRLAAISASGLVGYLVGLKRGVVPRLVYSATGATAMATVCCPEDAKTYNRRGLATVRRWILLGVSSVHSGPQKTLGGDRTGTSSKRKPTDNKETTKSSNNEEDKFNLFSAENIVLNLKQNLASLGSHLEDIKDRLKETTGNSTKVDKDSTKVDVTNVVYPSEISDKKTTSSEQNPSPKQAELLRSLSSKNDENVLKGVPVGSLPYSPALPAPPEVPSGRSKHRISVVEKEDALMTRKRSSEYLLSRSVDELSNGADNEGNGIVEQEEDLNDFSDMIFVIPTGGLEEKLEGKPEPLMKTHQNKSDERPLNKKLVSYYRNIPDEEKTSREKGYDDAYSNREK